MCFLSHSINTYIIFSISACLPAKSQIHTIWPFTQKACWPLSGSIHSALESKAPGVLSNLSAAMPPRDLICAEILLERSSIYRKDLGLGTEGRRICLGLSQDGNDPNRREMYRHKANSGRKQLPQSPWWCDVTQIWWGPAVVPVLSPLTQHCLFHCRLPFITEQ